MRSLHLTCGVYALGLAAGCLLLSRRRRAAGPAVLVAAGLLQLVVGLSAAVGVLDTVFGSRPRPGLHVAYLLVSVVLLPMLAGGSFVGGSGASGPRAGVQAGALTIALVGLAVVEFRILAM